MNWILALTLLLGLSAPPQDASVPTRMELEARIESVASLSTPEAVAETEQLRLAALALDRLEAARKAEEENRAAAAEVPGLIEGLRADLAKSPEPLTFPDAAAMSLEQREAELGRARAALGTAQAQVAELESRRTARQKRNEVLPTELAQKQKDLAVLQETLLSASESGEAGSAQRTRLAAEEAALRAELDKLEAERLANERRRELTPLRIEKAQRELQRADKLAQHWQEVVTEARQREASAAAKEAQQLRAETMRQFPSLESMAQRNEELATLRSGELGLPVRIAEAQGDLLERREDQLEVERRARAFERRQRIGGLTNGRGRALRADFDWLPAKAALREAERSEERRYAETFGLLLDIEEELAELAGFERDREQLMEQLGVAEPSQELQDVVTELLSARRRLLESVESEARTLLDVLEQLEVANTVLERSVNELREDIEERILWVRSLELGFLDALIGTPGAALEFVTESEWSSAAKEVLVQLRHRSRSVLLVVLAVALLLVLRRRMLRRRAHLCELVRSYRTDSLRHTLEALGLCLLQALPLSLVLWALAGLAGDASHPTAQAVAFALDGTLPPLLLFEFLRQVLRERGFGEAHLRWPARAVHDLRRELHWFEPTAVVLGFVFLLFDRQALAGYSETLGRDTFLLLMAVVGVFLSRLLRAEGPLPPSSGEGAPRGLLDRTRRIWATVAVLLPLVCFVLAAFGFYYTAVEFFSRLVLTVAFATALGFVNALLLRWLYITRRRLAIEQARERARARREASEAQAASTDPVVAPVDEETVDIPSLDAQTRQLFRSGMTMAAVLGVYFIWASTLPALQGLDRVQLWPTVTLLEVSPEQSAKDQREAAAAQAAQSQVASEAGGSAEAPAPGGSSIAAALPVATEPSGKSNGLPSILTLADVSLALIFALLTIIAARNLPGLLEISVLQRLPLDTGARYAVTTILRYLIVIIGLSVVFSTVGLGWKNIQWLAAALTFGLAFGLQEIFANFVSGLIILIERPVRVGDVVTVGGTEGKVTRLRMRATTIQDWDRREFLIPNKELIIGTVINWSLSDPVTRIIVPVGVAYGSDTKLARKLLLDVAKKSKMVLSDPGPRAIFRAFGASSLDFELRAFIPNRDAWPDVVDGLHSAIDDAFRKAKIEIAFPQRDLHLRSVPDGFLDGRGGSTDRDAEEAPAQPPAKGGGSGEGAAVSKKPKSAD